MSIETSSGRCRLSFSAWFRDPGELVHQYGNRASYRHNNLIAVPVDSGRNRGISLPVWDVLTSQTRLVGALARDREVTPLTNDSLYGPTHDLPKLPGRDILRRLVRNPEFDGDVL